MNRIVHHHKEDARRRFGDVRMPAVEQDRNMMVPMQEDEGLLVNDDEECIN